MRSLFAPEYAAAVADNGFRGDFVQVINRRHSDDEKLVEGWNFYTSLMLSKIQC